MMIKGRSTDRGQSLESPCPSEEEKGWAMQEIKKDLAHASACIWDLHSEIAKLKEESDALEKKVNPVSKLLEEKEEALLSEKSKYKALEQEHSKTLKLAKREIVMAMHEEYETNKTILEQSRANKQGIKDPKNEGIEAPLHESEAAIAGYEKALGLKSNAEDLRQANQRIKELDQSVNSCLTTSFDADRARALISTDGSLLCSGRNNWYVIQIDMEETNEKLARTKGQYHCKWYIPKPTTTKQGSPMTSPFWPLIKAFTDETTSGPTVPIRPSKVDQVLNKSPHKYAWYQKKVNIVEDGVYGPFDFERDYKIPDVVWEKVREAATQMKLKVANITPKSTPPGRVHKRARHK